MSEQIAYIAALHREISSLVQGWQVDVQPVDRNLLIYQRDRVVIAVAGMGAGRVALAVQAALRTGEVKELVSIGVAGACCAKHSVGSIVLPATVIDARTGERFTTAGGEGVLVSVARVASVLEKRRLSQSYHADLVDMEAATVARLAAAHHLHFRVIKAVSDGPDFELSDTTKFATSDGQFREAAFAFHALMRPRLWRPLLELARNSKLAISNLTTAVQADFKRNKKAE
jgi:adenosylhomocysteine nucleosidase